MLSDEYIYDYGSGGAGSLLKHTHIDYAGFAATPIYPSQPSILNRPSDVVIYDGGGNTVAETDYSYDQTGVSSVSATSHDNSNYGTGQTIRGNATTKTAKCLQSCTNAVSTYTYDETGQVTSVTDPCGNTTCSDMQSGQSHTTHYYYSDSFTSGTPPGNTDGYLTKIVNHIGQASTFSYDYPSGQLTNSKNQNDINVGRAGTTYIYDGLARPIEADLPDTGVTKYVYSDAPPTPTVTVCGLMSGSPSATCSASGPPAGWKTTMTTADGMGHITQTELASDPNGAIFTGTTYDGVGRIYQSSNPTRCSPPTTNCGSETTWGYTTTNYDTLNRITSVVKQDGSQVNVAYDQTNSNSGGVCTTSTDEAGHARQGCVNGIGQLTNVFEDPGASPHFNYRTDYYYDALNNLTDTYQFGSDSTQLHHRHFAYDSLSRLLSARNPEVGAVTNPGTIYYSYDANGNLISRAAPYGRNNTQVTTTYLYDALNRLYRKSYSDGSPWFWYDYDSAPSWMPDLKNVVGRLSASGNSYTGTSGPATSNTYSYDAIGRVVRKWELAPSAAAAFIYETYDLMGNPTSTTNPAGPVISYGYDSAAHLTSVTSSLQDSNHPSLLWSADPSQGYYPTGQLHKAKFGNGLYETTVVEPRLDPCRLSLNTSGGIPNGCSGALPSGVIQGFQLVYGNWGSTYNGNVTGWGAAGVINFNRFPAYDNLNRMVSMNDQWAPICTSLTFNVDAWGNMWGWSDATGSCSWSHPALANNSLTGYGYDYAGNMNADGSHSYVYDPENRLVQVDSNVTYVYDENGQRARKNNGSAFTEYFYGLNGEVVSEYNGSIIYREYVYAGNRLIAQYDDSANTTEFVHSDHLGSTRVVTGMNQAVIASLDYSAYGLLSGSGTTTTTHQYGGKENDAETNFDYFGARYYSPVMGRFLSLDWASNPEPVPYAKLDNPQTLNLYTYVNNNPISMRDPTGHCWSWAQALCNFGQRIDNTFHGEGFHTNQQVDQFHRAKSYLQEHNVNVGGLAFAAVIRTYQTYTKTNSQGTLYSGRTSGIGTAEQNIQLRDRTHHMNEQGYGPAELDKSSPNPDAIRGREQQLIEANGGAQSEGGTSGNAINGISRTNPNGPGYMSAAEEEFGASLVEGGSPLPVSEDPFVEQDILNNAVEAGGPCGASGNSPC